MPTKYRVGIGWVSAYADADRTHEHCPFPVGVLRGGDRRIRPRPPCLSTFYAARKRRRNTLGAACYHEPTLARGGGSMTSLSIPERSGRARQSSAAGSARRHSHRSAPAAHRLVGHHRICQAHKCGEENSQNRLEVVGPSAHLIEPRVGARQDIGQPDGTRPAETQSLAITVGWEMGLQQRRCPIRSNCASSRGTSSTRSVYIVGCSRNGARTGNKCFRVGQSHLKVPRPV